MRQLDVSRPVDVRQLLGLLLRKLAALVDGVANDDRC